MKIDTKTTDGCTGIPDKVFGVDVSDCCKAHDTTQPCGSRSFFYCLQTKLQGLAFGGVLALLIALGGALGCWIKYPKFMWKKL